MNLKRETYTLIIFNLDALELLCLRRQGCFKGVDDFALWRQSSNDTYFLINWTDTSNWCILGRKYC